MSACEQDTYGESRQCHLAVHPHVALHLPLQMFLGGELMRRNAVTGGRRREVWRWGDKRYHERSIIQSDVNFLRPSGCPGSGTLAERGDQTAAQTRRKSHLFIFSFICGRLSFIFSPLLRRLGTNSSFIVTVSRLEAAAAVLLGVHHQARSCLHNGC